MQKGSHSGGIHPTSPRESASRDGAPGVLRLVQDTGRSGLSGDGSKE
jgi:hypothetical protein